MIVDTAEARCTCEVLFMLSKDKARYNQMFKTTKVSHTTLQKVLKELEKDKFIQKNKIGSIDTEYEMTEKGKKFLIQIDVLKEILK
ncbi:MAG: winged helix-turn-helix transcriptional regulator [Nanoarchaeota archaeon]